jgi:dipeptidyl aminopeptidase/acylaminoacyl peptidase
MSTALPPAPPRPPRVDSPPDLEALIEEARRRARRRRRWYAASALLAAGAAVSAFAGYHHGGGSAGSRPSEARANANAATGASAGKAVRNGALTILAGSNISTIGATGRLKALFRCSGAKGCNELESVAWSPDGNRFAFGVGSMGATNFTANGLHIVDRRNGRDRHLTDSGLWFDLAWSPDGSRLAFVDKGRIGLINADGTGRQWMQTGTAGRDSSPTWSPDGTSLAFASEIWGRSAVYIVALAGPYAKRVVPSKLLIANASSPAWSPRGDRLAYSVGCGIRLITASGRDVTPPSAGGCRHIGIPGIPSWSPDGRQIAVVNGGGTFAMNADGSHLSRVTVTTPRLMTPGWPARRPYAPASWQSLH